MLLGTEGESVLPPSGLEEDSSALSALTYFNLLSRQRKVLPPLKTSKAGNQWRRRSYLEADCVILLGQSESPPSEPRCYYYVMYFIFPMLSPSRRGSRGETASTVMEWIYGR